VPDAYYEAVEARLPGHGEDLARLARNRVLIDGAPTRRRAPAADLHRHGDRADLLRDHPAQGRRRLGEGNFRALFESIELDQIRRGVLKPGTAA